MAGEIPLSPSEFKRDGQWPPIRHKATPSLRPLSPIPRPRQWSFVRAVLRRRPLSTINEHKAPSLKSDSTVDLRLNIAVPYQPFTWPYSSENLVCFCPSQQLQNFQSMSFYRTHEAYESTPKLYRTQSQWTAPPPRSYEPSGITVFQGLAIDETSIHTDLNNGEPLEPGASPIAAGEDLPREAIAELFHRVEEYEREHPEVVRESGRVWVRVNSVGHGLTKTFKTMSSLRKKQTFEARLGHNIPVQSRLRVYEKPSRVKRMEIAAHDCWRRFRNWSTGRNTELRVKKNVISQPYPIMNISIVSLTVPESSPTGTRPGSRKLSRAPKLEETADSTMCVRRARKDSKLCVSDRLKRRKSSLFLDVHPSDFSDGSLRG